MATQLWLIRRPDGLFECATEQDAETAAAIPCGEWRRATFRLPRNVGHHKKYWALISVATNYSDFPTVEVFHVWLKRALGYADLHLGPNDQEIWIDTPTNFAKMDQAQFQKYYDHAVKFILRRIVPAVDHENFFNEIQDILNGAK